MSKALPLRILMRLWVPQDRFWMLLDGHSFFFELKARKGVVTEIQKQTHQALVKAGADVAIVRGGELGK